MNGSTLIALMDALRALNGPVSDSLSRAVGAWPDGRGRVSWNRGERIGERTMSRAAMRRIHH